MIINELTVVGANHLVEKAFITEEGYQGVCVFSKCNVNRTGYVGVPQGHPLFGRDLWEDLIVVHGGVSFTNWLFDDALWYYGFHCGHSLTDVPDQEFLCKIDPKSSYSTYVLYPGATVKDLNFVIKEVMRLSSQMTPAALMQAKMEMEE